MYEPAEQQASVPIAVQFLRRACLALDTDASVARHDIRRALELLVDSEIRIPVERPVQGLTAWQARAVIDHIVAHLDQPIHIEDVAAVTRLSKGHFSRAFKLSFRMSPHAYVVALRLTHSRALLTDSDQQLCQIAVACGFADQSHFSRVFRRRMGCTPGLWRREHFSHPTNDGATPIESRDRAGASRQHHFEFRRFARDDNVAA